MRGCKNLRQRSKQALHNNFCLTVYVGWCEGMVLWDRHGLRPKPNAYKHEWKHLWVAINASAAAEDKGVNATQFMGTEWASINAPKLLAELEKIDGRCDVVAVVEERVAHRLAYSLESSEVNYAANELCCVIALSRRGLSQERTPR